MATPVTLDGKKLSEFRVVDLRQELEKRGCEKSGVKAVLIERLQKVKSVYCAVFLAGCKSRLSMFSSPVGSVPFHVVWWTEQLFSHPIIIYR